ncbi:MULTISPECIES: DUF6586 family protein [Marinomonas]|jgi:hypothetical protein|uniref:Uncharacterized protein n=1 Tax=Marinomonas polaris DSM 16579 TaxID=1122206 RepID=A0A1M4ZZ26_9GAMM|nr:MULTISPECIES: DUF6586 family protein [Marinomonas]PJE56893.1 hypothetical protein TY87_01665 [Marinomonas sp. BSi20584]SHF23279.1 hypothetical protein SAMN02745753_01549 [Marinomonas polaris DSM 16579]|tara:strand:+ start:2566 stop:3036 length:471 start_codon:yes stop_codon:yes gene_type:complete
MSGASLASLTNQKLDTARRFIKQSQDSDEAWLRVGLESSAIFQLRSALNGLLKEVNAAYSLSGSLDVAKLLAESEDKQIVVPVLAELADLLSRTDSWCFQLNQAYLVQFECRTSMSSVVQSDSLIGRGSDAGASVSFYLAKLVELVLRFREESSEY